MDSTRIKSLDKISLIILFILSVTAFLFFTTMTGRYDIGFGCKKLIISAIFTCPVDVDVDISQLKIEQSHELMDEIELTLLSEDKNAINEALEAVRILSQANVARASLLLAHMYELGIVVTADSDIALNYYKQASLQGSQDANIFIFNKYFDADELSDDNYKEAFAWFNKVAQVTRSAIAHYALGDIYLNGLGQDKNIENAEKHYHQAVDYGIKQDFYLAFPPLLRIYVDSGNATGAFDLLHIMSSNSRDGESQFKLAFLYEEGLGTEQNFDEAYYWYEQASQNDSVEALTAMGRLSLEGLGTKKNVVKAFELFQDAVNKGSREAEPFLANMYERGLGTAQDLVMAIYWYRNGAEYGDAESQYNVGRIYEEYESERDLEKAKFWYRKALKSSFQEAQEALERLHDLPGKIEENDSEER